MIQYYSTKDSSKAKLGFKEALLTGLAPDGGLYVPDSFPKFDFDTLSASSLAEIGSQVLYPYMQENLEQAELDAILQDALNFPAPLHKLDPSLYVLELFHGPTLSFKDFAARTMARRNHTGRNLW